LPNPENEEQSLQNIRHIKTRTLVERVIGIWKGRFRSMHMSEGALCYKPKKACKLMLASACLHNFCTRQQMELSMEDEHYIEAMQRDD